MKKSNYISDYILGVRVDYGLDTESLIEEMDGLIKRETFDYVCTTNPEFILEALSDEYFKEIINKSSLSIPDGYGVLLAKNFLDEVSRYKVPRPIKVALNLLVGIKIGLQPHPAYERLAGSEIIFPLCKLCEERRYNVFLLGGWPRSLLGKRLNGHHDVAGDVEKVLQHKFPDLKIIGATSKFSPNPSDDAATITYIKNCMKKSSVDHIDVLLVAYGQNKQEQWLLRNAKEIPVGLGIGVGGSFDYIAGVSPAAPIIFKHFHAEWLFRLFSQPYRLRRVANAVIKFPLLTYIFSLK